MYFLCKTPEKGTQAGWGGSRCYRLTQKKKSLSSFLKAGRSTPKNGGAAE